MSLKKKWNLNKKKCFVISVFLLLLLAASFVFVRFLFYEGYIRLNYPSYADYPIQGIDVSNHQKVIDWETLDKQQVQFAFIKATEGGDFKDRSFQRNWSSAQQVGIVRGAYHFFTFCREGELQARNFIETVPNDSTMLPPVVDLEYGGNCKLARPKEDVLKDIDIFISMLEQEYNRRVIIYVTDDFYEDFLIGRYPNNPIWFRDIRKKPQIKDGRSWLFWQFANRGRLEGIEGFVDLNVFSGSKEDFDKLLTERIHTH